MHEVSAPAGLRFALRRGERAWVAGALVVAVLLPAGAGLESRARRIEAERLAATHGSGLADALRRSIEHVLASSLEIEGLASARLLDDARLLDRLDATERLGTAELDRLCEELGLRGVMFYDGLVQRVREGRPGDGAYPSGPDPYVEAIAPLVSGDRDEIVLGVRRDREGGGILYAAAVRREDGGAVLVTIDAGTLFAVKERTGVAPLLRGVVGAGGILSATLTDDAGRVVASAGTAAAPASGAATLSRPVDRGAAAPWTLSLGLSRDDVAAAARAGRRRVAAASILAALVLATAGAVVIARRP